MTASNAQSKVIIDGDWGGDEMQLAAVLLAHPESATVVGITTVFGNTSLTRVVKNAGNILHFLNHLHIPYFVGSAHPTNTPTPKGDKAHGDDGVGGADLPTTPAPPHDGSAIDFILATLRESPKNTVTITATGPLTNIARAFVKDPETMKRVKRILIMGGCTTDMPAHDLSLRRGNITPTAEFNFYMAPRDAEIVMKSGIAVTLFPMNCTHQMTLTPEREKMIATAFTSTPALGQTIIQAMSAPAELDRMKFNSCPVMHDVHTALYQIYPDLYQGRQGSVAVMLDGSAKGHTIFEPTPDGSVMVMEQIVDADKLFDCVLKSFQHLLQIRNVLPQPTQPIPTPLLGAALNVTRT